MADCENYIRQAVRSIEPTKAQKDAASRSHNFLRQILCTGQYESRVTSSYLSGSYARDTAIAPLDDVDIIFTIDPRGWSSSSFFSTEPSPEVVLQSFARAVRYRYPSSSVRVQRRSICLQLNHLDIDVVPAIAKDDAGVIIVIPDRDAGSWIRSSPKTHSDFSTKVNLMHQGRLKPLIKLLKYWNSQLPSTAKFKSFAIETMVVRLFEKTGLASLQAGLLVFFDYVAYLGGRPPHFGGWNNIKTGMSLGFLPCVMDAAGIGNLLVSVDSERLQKFILHAIRSRDKLLAAKEAVSVETSWRRVAEALKI